MKRQFFLTLLVGLIGLTAFNRPVTAAPAKSFIEEHSQLKKYLFKERTSAFYLSLGVSPLTLLSSRIMFSLAAFQLHWISGRWDVEAFSASFGFGIASNSLSSSRQVLLRTSPKFRINSIFSAGPLLGWEYVSFPNASSKIFQGTQITPGYEPFSQNGPVYGIAVSETIALADGYQLRVNELVYRETYSTTTTSNGWSFFFQDTGLQTDTSPIKPSTVISLEFCLLF